MQVTRIYTGPDHQSHFEELEVPLSPQRGGLLSELLPSAGVWFRETPAGVEQDFHNAPRRQFVITLSGAAEIECGDGTVRRLGPGDILLADDLTGQGHITRDVEGPRHTLILPLSDDLSVEAWRR